MHLQDDGAPSISRPTISYVLARIGIRDPVVASRIFDAWDEQRVGVLDLRAFLHALVLALHGTSRDKLGACFTIADTDGDGMNTQRHIDATVSCGHALAHSHAAAPAGIVSRNDVARFFKDVWAFSGRPANEQEIRMQVRVLI